MGSLDRLPAWATTGVGSLPLAGFRQAAAHAVTAYDVPFCPQLTALEGDMVTEWLGADPRRCGWSPDRDRRVPLVWDELLGELAARPPSHGVVKLQVTGPLTLAGALERRRGGVLDRAGGLALAGELATWLAANTATWTSALAARGLTALVVADEPGVHAFGTRGVEHVWAPLRAIAPAFGLHLCCAVPWDVVPRAGVDVLSFDLALAGLDDRGARAIRELVDAGGRVAWGALAVDRPDGAATALARLRRALRRTGTSGSRSLITASCGTGLVSPEREARIAATLREVAAALGGAPVAPSR